MVLVLLLLAPGLLTPGPQVLAQGAHPRRPGQQPDSQPVGAWLKLPKGSRGAVVFLSVVSPSVAAIEGTWESWAPPVAP